MKPLSISSIMASCLVDPVDSGQVHLGRARVAAASSGQVAARRGEPTNADTACARGDVPFEWPPTHRETALPCVQRGAARLRDMPRNLGHAAKPDRLPCAGNRPNRESPRPPSNAHHLRAIRRKFAIGKALNPSLPVNGSPCNPAQRRSRPLHGLPRQSCSLGRSLGRSLVGHALRGRTSRGTATGTSASPRGSDR